FSLSKAPQCLAISPDGRKLAAGYMQPDGVSKGGLVLWDVSTRESTVIDQTTKGAIGAGGVTRLAFSPDGRKLAIGGTVTDGKPFPSGVFLWDLEAKKPISDLIEIRGSSSAIGAIAFSPDGGTLAIGYSGSNHGELVLWDVGSNNAIGAPITIREGD